MYGRRLVCLHTDECVRRAGSFKLIFEEDWAGVGDGMEDNLQMPSFYINCAFSFFPFFFFGSTLDRFLLGDVTVDIYFFPFCCSLQLIHQFRYFDSLEFLASLPQVQLEHQISIFLTLHRNRKCLV